MNSKELLLKHVEKNHKEAQRHGKLSIVVDCIIIPMAILAFCLCVYSGIVTNSIGMRVLFAGLCVLNAYNTISLAKSIKRMKGLLHKENEVYRQFMDSVCSDDETDV